MRALTRIPRSTSCDALKGLHSLTNLPQNPLPEESTSHRKQTDRLNYLDLAMSFGPKHKDLKGPKVQKPADTSQSKIKDLAPAHDKFLVTITKQSAEQWDDIAWAYFEKKYGASFKDTQELKSFFNEIARNVPWRKTLEQVENFFQLIENLPLNLSGSDQELSAISSLDSIQAENLLSLVQKINAQKHSLKELECLELSKSEEELSTLQTELLEKNDTLSKLFKSLPASIKALFPNAVVKLEQQAKFIDDFIKEIKTIKSDFPKAESLDLEDLKNLLDQQNNEKTKLTNLFNDISTINKILEFANSFLPENQDIDTKTQQSNELFKLFTKTSKEAARVRFLKSKKEQLAQLALTIGKYDSNIPVDFKKLSLQIEFSRNFLSQLSGNQYQNTVGLKEFVQEEKVNNSQSATLVKIQVDELEGLKKQASNRHSCLKKACELIQQLSTQIIGQAPIDVAKLASLEQGVQEWDQFIKNLISSGILKDRSFFPYIPPPLINKNVLKACFKLPQKTLQQIFSDRQPRHLIESALDHGEYEFVKAMLDYDRAAVHFKETVETKEFFSAFVKSWYKADTAQKHTMGVELAQKIFKTEYLTDTIYSPPLHIASHAGYTEMVEFLVKEIKSSPENSSLINFQDHEGKTALHYAAARGHYSIVDNLIKAGAENKLNKQEEILLNRFLENRDKEAAAAENEQKPSGALKALEALENKDRSSSILSDLTTDPTDSNKVSRSNSTSSSQPVIESAQTSPNINQTNPSDASPLTGSGQRPQNKSFFQRFWSGLLKVIRFIFFMKAKA